MENEQTIPKTGDDVLEKIEPKTARGRRYRVVFLNDDYTTKWFVVMVLEQIFHMNETAAMAQTSLARAATASSESWSRSASPGSEHV